MGGFFSDLFTNTFDPKYGFLGRPVSGALRAAIDFGRSTAQQVGPYATPWLDPNIYKEDPETTNWLDEVLGGNFKQKMMDEPVQQRAETLMPGADYSGKTAGQLARAAIFPDTAYGDYPATETVSDELGGSINRPISSQERLKNISIRHQLGGAGESLVDVVADPTNLAIPAEPLLGAAFLPGIIRSGIENFKQGEYGKALVDMGFGGAIGAHTAKQFRGPRAEPIGTLVEKAAQIPTPEGGYPVKPTDLAAAPKDINLDELLAPERAKLATKADYNTRYKNMTESFVRRIKDEAARVLNNENIKDVSIELDPSLKGAAAFSRELNTMYLNPDMLDQIDAKTILHEISHTNSPHSNRMEVTNLEGDKVGRIPINNETMAEVPAEMVEHNWDNQYEVSKFNPTEHEFVTNEESLTNNPDIRGVADKFDNNRKRLLAEKFRGERNLPTIESEPETDARLKLEATPVGSNDPVVKFTEGMRAKYGDKWATSLTDSEREDFNTVLKGEELSPPPKPEGEFTAVEDIGSKLNETPPVEAPPPTPVKEIPTPESPLEAARKAVTADKPIVKWRITFNDGNTVSVEAADRGVAAQIARRDFANGRKVAGISEAASTGVPGEVRSDITEKQSTYVVKLSDGSSRTVRAYSESQARNAVEKPLTTVGSDLKVEAIHVREKGEDTSPSSRRAGVTSEPVVESKSEPVHEVVGSTPEEIAKDVRALTHESVIPKPLEGDAFNKALDSVKLDTESLSTEKPKYDPWQEALNKLKTEPVEEPTKATSTETPTTKPQKTWTDPKYKHTWKVVEVKDGVAYLERTEGGAIKRRTIYESDLEVGKGKAPKSELVSETIVKNEPVLGPEEVKAKPVTKPTKEEMPVAEKGVPDEVLTDKKFITFMQSKGYDVSPDSYAGFSKKGVPSKSSDVWAQWKEFDRDGDLIVKRMEEMAEGQDTSYEVTLSDGTTHKMKATSPEEAQAKVEEVLAEFESSKTVDKVEEALTSLQKAAKYEVDPTKQGMEEVTDASEKAKVAKKEETGLLREEDKLRASQNKEKFKKTPYEVTFSNGRTVTVNARNETAAREYAAREAKKFKPGVTVSAVSRKASPIEAAVTGISKKVEESSILNSPLAKLLGSAKSLAFGGDVGHLLRQGKQMNADLLFSKHAKATIDQFPIIFKAAKSKEFFDNFHKKLYSDPTIKMMVDTFKLDMPGLGEHLREEAFHGSAAENIPLIGKFYARPSERAYTAGLNFLRAAEVKKLVGSLEKKGFTPENAPEKYRAVAKAVNIISQRGDFNPAYQKIFSDLSLVYGAPRAKAARLQNLAELFRGGTSGDVARLTAAKTLAFNTVMLGMIQATMGGKFITDSEQSDFLKYRINDKITIDPLVGLGVTARTLAKMYNGGAISAYTGNKVQSSWGKAIGDEALSGLAPGVQLMIEGVFGRDTRGYQVDRMKSLLNVTPMTARNIVELLQSGETEDAFVLALLQAGGEGVNVFDIDKAREEETRLKEERGISTGKGKHKGTSYRF